MYRASQRALPLLMERVYIFGWGDPWKGEIVGDSLCTRVISPSSSQPCDSLAGRDRGDH